MKKSRKKSSKKPLTLPISRTGLTPTEKKIIHQIKVGCVTQNQIASRLKITKQAVFHHIKNLRKKGVIGKTLTLYNTDSQGSAKKVKGDRYFWRLHGEHFRIWILDHGSKYESSRAESNLIHVGDATVELYDNSVRVHLGSFFGDTVAEVKRQSYAEFRRICRTMEARLGVYLLKSGKHNIKRYGGEIAHTNDPMAADLNDEDKKLFVPDPIDGKLALKVDRSHGLHEFEAVHPERADIHAEDYLEPFYFDLIKHRPQLLSKQDADIQKLAFFSKEIAAGLASLIKLVSPEIVGEAPDSADKKGGVPDYVG